MKLYEIVSDKLLLDTNILYRASVIRLMNKIVHLSTIKCNYYRLVSLFSEWRRPYRLGGAGRARSAELGVATLALSRQVSTMLGTYHCKFKGCVTAFFRRSALNFPYETYLHDLNIKMIKIFSKYSS